MSQVQLLSEKKKINPLSLALAVATGGASLGVTGALAAGGLNIASQRNPAIGRAVDAYDSAKNISDMASQSPTPYADQAMGSQFKTSGPSLGEYDLNAAPSVTDQTFQQPELGSAYQNASESAMSRRMGVMNQDPQMALSSGLEALNDRSIPFEIRNQAAPYLFMGKQLMQRGGIR